MNRKYLLLCLLLKISTSSLVLGADFYVSAVRESASRTADFRHSHYNAVGRLTPGAFPNINTLNLSSY